MRKIVLLPEPFGPSRPTISPGSIAKDTSLTAHRGPYHLVRCCASTTGGMLLTHYLLLTRYIQHAVERRGRSTAKTKNGKQTRAYGPGLQHHATRLVGCLFVEFGRVLLRLEAIGIVRHEDVGAFHVPHSPHPRIGIEHAGRIIDAADARQDVLVEILLQINSVAGEHGRTALGQADDHHLAAGRVRDGAVDFDAVI